MPPPKGIPNRALPYWGIIERGAAEGLGAADLWADIRAAAEDIGLASPGVSASEVSQLYSQAVGIQRKAERFGRAHPSERMDGRYVANAPWTRAQGERDALSVWQVRYQHTVLGPDGPQSEWRTSVFSGALPDTVEDLRAAIEQDAEQLALKYGFAHVGTDDHQVLEV